MILQSNLHKTIEKGEFSLDFVASDGELVHVERAICTSWHSRGRTMNIKILPSNEIRTIRRCTIVAFNDEEVAI